jgi:sporulation protein YlmC with PRC-barrel domain
MKSDFSTLRNKPVETADGQPLGKIIDAEIDLSIHAIMKYTVSPNRWLGFKQNLLISPNQIVQITDTKIIVDDMAIKEKPEHAVSDELTGLANPAAIGSQINYAG